METIDGQKEKDLFATMTGMSFDTMKVYFYDMKETKSFKRQDGLNMLGI